MAISADCKRTALQVGMERKIINNSVRPFVKGCVVGAQGHLENKTSNPLVSMYSPVAFADGHIHFIDWASRFSRFRAHANLEEPVEHCTSVPVSASRKKLFLHRAAKSLPLAFTKIHIPKSCRRGKNRTKKPRNETKPKNDSN